MSSRAHVFTCLALLLFASTMNAQPAGTSPPSDLAKILTFETEHKTGVPGGWGGGPAGTIFADDKVVHGGRWSARLEPAPGNQPGFTSMTKSIPMDFAGSRIELRGFLRTDAVGGFAALWLREDGDAGPVAFDNMQGRQLKGTNEWAQYSISLPLSPDARRLFFGVLLSGDGRAWADDLEVLVDGKPVWDAPRVERPKTVIELDREFDNGSGIVLQALTPLQTENLTTLGTVWGFLKYHHPQVVQGTRHWDYELFRIMPAVMAARDRAAANAAVLAWVGKLGEVAPCNPCARLEESDLHLRPQPEWLSDEARLGPDLSRALLAVYRNRPPVGPQFYVSLAPGVKNPSFDHELMYAALKLPDAGYQLLALFRFWNIIRYWAPYRDAAGVDWDSVLPRFVPRVALAKSIDSYKLEMIALIATVNDTHANLWGSLDVRPPAGPCQLPVHVRFIEDRAVVAGYMSEEAGTASGLKAGDVITTLDGTPIASLVERWKPYYAASNEPTRLRDIGEALTRGACGEAAVGILRDREALVLRPSRVPAGSTPAEAALAHDLPGETFRRLSDAVAYLKLSSVKSADLGRYIESAAGTRGLIIDIRNYPSEFVVFTLGSLVAEKPAEFVRFTSGDLANPGAFHWSPPLSLPVGKPHYAGKVVVLVDEVSQSQAEYTAMALRAAGAVVIGGTTAGADGNVSAVPLPGGLRSMISGIGVFYPDKKPTQRIGIVADVRVQPTIAGVRAGRDEVLEEALRRILGPDTPAGEIEKIARAARAGSAPAKPPPSK